MKYTLRQLNVFLATARCQNISQAASSLAMSQSAASGALKDLEERYSIKLFDRVGKRLQLNAQGRELLPHVEALISQAEEVESVLFQHEPSSALKIGATLTIGNYIAVNIISKFKRSHPLVDIQLHVANTLHIAQEVLDFKMDIGLIEGEYAHSELSVEPWRDDELAVFCSPNHPYAKNGTLNDEQIIQAQWVLRERGSGTRQTFDRAMRGLQNNIKIFLELEHTEAIKRAVETGDSLGCLSRIALEDGFKSERFVELKVPSKDMRRKFYFIMHNKKHLSRSLKNWIECCRRYN